MRFFGKRTLEDELQATIDDLWARTGLGGIPRLDRRRRDDGSPHVEVHAGRYDIVVTERGNELDRQTGVSRMEAARYFLSLYAGEHASAAELDYRRENGSGYSRWNWMAPKIAIMQSILPEFGAWTEQDYLQVLSRYPLTEEEMRHTRYPLPFRSSPGTPISDETEVPMFFSKPAGMVRAEDALSGRPDPLPTAETHFVSGVPIKSPVPDGFEQAMFGMGCFWGVERKFWQIPGVWLTVVGYAGGFTPNPTYKETCTQLTGHNEVVRVIYDPTVVTYDDLLRVFWENHDPTQGMRQGNDVGSTYRSGVYPYDDAQKAKAEASRDAFAEKLRAAGYPAVTTEIVPAPEFFYAEDYHQQYLAKNPDGYCALRGTGVTC